MFGTVDCTHNCFQGMKLHVKLLKKISVGLDDTVLEESLDLGAGKARV